MRPPDFGAITMAPHLDELALQEKFPNATSEEMALWDAVFAAVSSRPDAGQADVAHRWASAAVMRRRQTFQKGP